MKFTFDTNVPKKATNLSINGDLLRQAKALNINLSKTLEGRLSEIIREARSQQWRQENHSAIISYNRQIEQRGVFSDKLRSF